METRPQNEDNQFSNLTILSTQVLNEEVRCNAEEKSQRSSEENPASKDSQSCFSDPTKATNDGFLIILNEQFVTENVGQTLWIDQAQLATQHPTCNDELNVCQRNGQDCSSAGSSKRRENDDEGRVTHSAKKKKELPSVATSIQTSDSVPKKVRGVLVRDSPSYCCNTCDKTFSNKRAWTRHQQEHSKLLDCQKCGKLFTLKSCFIRHQASHSKKRPYKCRFCDLRFKYNESKLMHERCMHTEIACFECAVCGKMFNRKSSIIRHVQLHSGVKPFRCQTCGTRFAQKQQLIRHKRMHSKEKKFKCHICDKLFRHPDHKTAHERSHVEGPRLECALCGKKYWHKGDLVQHISYKHKNTMHMEVEVSCFECTLCGKTYRTKKGLAYHTSKQVCSKSQERLHMKVPRFECTLCGKKYLWKQNLVYHISHNCS